MSDQTVTRRPSQFLPNLLKISGVAVILISFFWPEQVWPLVVFVVKSLAGVAAIVIPGIFLAAWVTASGAGDRIAKVFEGRIGYTVVVASAIGAVTPVCGVTVLPLMAGLLAAGVPLAPVMAFWLSSPVTDPPMFATTVAMLGMSFAVGKTLAAFFLGISGGLVTAFFFTRSWYRKPLRENAIVGSLGATSCGAPVSCEPAVWKFPERRKRFSKEAWSITRLILICLIPAFAAEYALNALLQPEALTPYIGAGKWWAVPMAVFVGAPAYLDGYAALPLARGLIEHGMSQGAAMGFLVSGSVVSIWGAMAIFPVLKIRPFLLYLVLATSGSLAAGWLFELAV